MNKKVLVIGLGSIGERHVRNLIDIGVKDIGVLRRSESKARTFDIAKVRQFINKKDALSWKPEFVLICTPSNDHFDHIGYWIKHTDNILIEVPLSSSLENRKLINNLASKKDKRILMGHNIRFHPALRAIKEIVEKKELGDLLLNRSHFGEYLPDLHTWEDFRSRYEARKSLGGGATLTSIHEIDHAIWLSGRVNKVTGLIRTVSLDIDCEDLSLMILEHENGKISEICLDFIQRSYTRNLQLTFTEGLLEWSLKGNHISVYSSKQGNGWKNRLDLKSFDFNQTYIDELKFFLREEKNEDFNNLNSGIHTLEVALAVKESSHLGKTISIDARI